VSVVGLYGCKQAPGVTTLALALASVLDADGGALVLEVDPQGGDIGALLGRPATPGLLTIAAAGRHGGPVDIEQHLQVLPGGGRVLLAPSDGAQVSAALRAVGQRLVTVATSVTNHVVIDHGRGLEPLDAEDLAVLVCHPTVAGVEQARIRSEQLEVAGADVAIVLSAAGPYRADEVAGALERPVLSTIPHDQRGAIGLTGAGGGAGMRRSPLVRAAASMADELRTLDDDREMAW
jgi:hypothetical protein